MKTFEQGIAILFAMMEDIKKCGKNSQMLLMISGIFMLNKIKLNRKLRNDVTLSMSMRNALITDFDNAIMDIMEQINISESQVMKKFDVF